MGHPEAAEDPPDEIARGVIAFDETNDVVALTGEGEQSLRDHSHPGRGDQAVLAPLQLCEQQFELAQGRVRAARVIEAATLRAQVTLGLFRGVELEFDRLVDRRHHRVIVGWQLYGGRMIDTSGFLHAATARAACVRQVQEFWPMISEAAVEEIPRQLP